MPLLDDCQANARASSGSMKPGLPPELTRLLHKWAADSRVNLQQVVVLGVGGEEVGDADHGAAEGPPVLHAAQVLLLAGAHPACRRRSVRGEGKHHRRRQRRRRRDSHLF